jgi:hypothetical protein
MSLTTQQLQTLKTAIAADPVLAAKPNNSDGAFDIATAFNLLATPDFVVWKSKVFQDEITQNGFTWTEVDNLTVGKARIWEWLFDNQDRSFNPSKPNVRAGIAECWSGTAGRLAVQAVVLGHCKRKATRAEKLFSSGTGSDATPATMGYEGNISYQDVQDARALP